MAEDFPIYSDMKLRTGLQFSDLEKFRYADAGPVWDRSDAYIEQMEGGANIRSVRTREEGPSRELLLSAHAAIFAGRDGAGLLRQTVALPRYRGHDCPEPQFIERSLANFFVWVTAESFIEIHPVERAAIVLSRIVDIWPFEFGNLTMAFVLANVFLKQDGFSPFFVMPQHMKEFESALAQAMTINTQPLVNAIHGTIRREMESIASR